MPVENCYRCSHYQVCVLRISIVDLLDEGHHKQIKGGKSVLRNSIPLPFFELLARICKLASAWEEE